MDVGRLKNWKNRQFFSSSQMSVHIATIASLIVVSQMSVHTATIARLIVADVCTHCDYRKVNREEDEEEETKKFF